MGERGNALSPNQGSPGVGDFLLGLIPGFSKGMAEAQEQKKRDAYISAQTDLIKQEAKVKEKALIAENMKANILGKMTPEQQMAALFPKADDTLEAKLATINKFFSGGQPSAPLPPYDPGASPGTGPTRPGAMSIPDTIAQGQVGSMSGMGGVGLTKEDLVRGVLKKELGAEPMSYHRTATVAGPDGNPWVAPMDMMGNLDMTKARPAPVKIDMQLGVGPGMAPVQTPVNPYSRQPVGAPIQTGPPPMIQGQAVTPGGGAAPYAVPMFGGGGGGAQPPRGVGGLRTKLDVADTPIDEAAARMYRMPDGSMPKVGIDTPKQIFAKGGKLVSAKMLEIEGPIKVVGELVNQLEDYSFGPGGIFSGIKPGMFNRATQGMSDQVKSFMQTSGRGEKIALYEGYKQAFAGSLARTVMFEVGVMTDQDIARAVKAVPVILPIPDTEDVARAKLKLIRGFIGNLDSVKDRKSMESALSRLESGVKALNKGAKPDLSLGKSKPALDLGKGKQESKFEIIEVR